MRARSIFALAVSAGVLAGCSPSNPAPVPKAKRPVVTAKTFFRQDTPPAATFRLTIGQDAIVYGIKYGTKLKTIDAFLENPPSPDTMFGHSDLNPGDRLIILDDDGDESDPERHVRVRIETGRRAGNVGVVARRDIRLKPR
jgi:hypothetical protein